MFWSLDVKTKEQNTVEIIVGLVLPAEWRTGAELDVRTALELVLDVAVAVAVMLISAGINTKR